MNRAAFFTMAAFAIGVPARGEVLFSEDFSNGLGAMEATTLCGSGAEWSVAEDCFNSNAAPSPRFTLAGVSIRAAVPTVPETSAPRSNRP